MTLEELSKKELLAECKRLGIEVHHATGEKKLIALIKEASTNKIAEPETPSLIIDTAALEEEIEKFDLPEEVVYGNRATTADGFPVDDVVDECNVLFAGAAVARYNENNPHCIEFRGGARKMQDVTIHQNRSAIFMYARTYVSRAQLASGVMSGGAIAGRENTNLANLDVASMTPQQKEEFKRQIEQVMGA